MSRKLRAVGAGEAAAAFGGNHVLPRPAAHPDGGPRWRPSAGTAIAVLRHLTDRAGRPALPRSTVRLRLAALYGSLFLLSGAGLLAITNAVARGLPWPGAGAGSLPLLPSGSQHLHQLAVQEAQQHAAELNQLLAGSAVALGVMAVVSVALGWGVAGRVLRSLREMTAAARRISEDNLQERLAVPGPGDELKDLGDTIDGLLGRLEGAFTAQRRFVANASHELRTPLAMMRTSLDVAVAKPGRSRLR